PGRDGVPSATAPDILSDPAVSKLQGRSGSRYKSMLRPEPAEGRGKLGVAACPRPSSGGRRRHHGSPGEPRRGPPPGASASGTSSGSTTSTSREGSSGRV